MRPIGAFFRRVAALLSSRRREDELRDEIDAHIERRREALVDEGMDPRDAAFEARRMFGNVTRVREQSRESWSFPVMHSILQDIRYGARLLRRSPFFTLVAVTSIAFGLGGGLIIFTIANAGIFRPLAGADADLHRVYTANRGGTVYGGNSYADHRDFARTSPYAARRPGRRAPSSPRGASTCSGCPRMRDDSSARTRRGRPKWSSATRCGTGGSAPRRPRSGRASF